MQGSHEIWHRTVALISKQYFLQQLENKRPNGMSSPFFLLFFSLPSRKLPSDIQAILRLKLHSGHTEHIFHALTEWRDTGATAHAGQRSPGGEGNRLSLECLWTD